jgi:hypothetical protein
VEVTLTKRKVLPMSGEFFAELTFMGILPNETA